MKHIIYIILWGMCLLFLVVACKHYNINKPKQLMTANDVEEVLYQMYIIEGKARLLRMDSSNWVLRRWTNEEVNALLDSFHVDYPTFKANMDYYFANEEQAKAIQMNITNRLLQKHAQQSKVVQKMHEMQSSQSASDTIVVSKVNKEYNQLNN